MELGKWSRARSGDFRPRPERAHFPRCARREEQRGSASRGGGGASCGGGGGGGTAAGRGAGAQNTAGAGAQPPFAKGRREECLAQYAECIAECPNPSPAPPRLRPSPCPAGARIVGRLKTLDFLVRRLKAAPGAAGGQKTAGGEIE